jgi:Cu-Zn family superoxide dismutase
MSRAVVTLAVAAAAATAAVPAIATDVHHGHQANGGWQGGGGGHRSRLPVTYSLPGAALFPEGLGYDRDTGNFYTGSVVDGTIVRGNIRSPQATVFSPAGADGRTSVLGMRTDRSRLYVAGGASGTVYIYDTRSGRFIAKVSNGLPATGTLLNDLAVTPSGVYVTDSTSPSIWRVDRTPGGGFALEKWLDLTGTAFTYTTGPNADGIQATPDGKALIVGALNTGKLYRIDLATKAVSVIDTGGADLTNADGIELVGHDLYVARNVNNQIVKLNLSDDWATAAVDTVTTSPRFDYSVGVVAAGDRLLVLNSQFEHSTLVGGTPTPPTLPFTVTAITRP